MLPSLPVANGLRTDHPIPDLPFVDDGHIPVEDPAAVEAVGRHKGEGRWGRCDTVRDGGGWIAFTTDPQRYDLAWCIRWHPEHGRSVVLYRDEDASGIHTTLAWELPALLFRAGGYWWDGTTWYRPAQVWDAASEHYVGRPVPAARTVTAADLLPTDLSPDLGQILKIEEVDLDAPLRGRWRDDLALWAARRAIEDGGSLPDCVVTLTAPELSGDQLVGVAELAEIGGIAASTLRAYLSRGEGDVPHSQATVNGHSMWSRPVAEEWAEQRRRSPEGVEATISTAQIGSAAVPVGIADVWTRFSRAFFSALWTRPERRKRWALRWRNQDAVQAVAEELGWYVAADLTGYSSGIIPIGDLASTIRQATLHEFAIAQKLDREINSDDDDTSSWQEYGLGLPLARMLDWLIRHSPKAASRTIGDIIGEAERELQIPRKVSERSLRTALRLDGKLDSDTLTKFLEQVMSPSPTSPTN